MAMIKKSRKILTLLLASLLIMSSMCALTVSADGATSYEITDGTTVINSSNKTKSYTFTHSLETGYYTLKVGATVPSTDDGMLTVKATIGSDSWSGDHRFTTTSRTITTGTFYLTQGESYTVELAGTFGTSKDVTITKLTFSKFTNIVQLSTTEENEVSVLDYFNRKFRTGNADRESSSYSWAGEDATKGPKAVLSANCFVINRVSVPSDTWYDVYSVAGTTTSYKPKLTLSVDDTAVISEVAAAITGALGTNAYTHLGKLKLTAGTHDLKLLTSNTMYLRGMRLVPCSLNTDIAVSSSNSPEFSFYNDKVASIASSFTDGGASYGPPSIAEGQDFTLDGTDGYVSAASGDYATYLVNVTEAGMYDINFVGGQRPVALNVLIDGVQPVKSLSSTFLKGSGTGAVNSNVVKATAATVYLTQGFHEIKFEFTNSTANWLYKWSVEPTTAVTNLSTTGTTTISTDSTKYYDYTDDSSEIYSGYVVARASKTFYYVVNAPAAGQYTLTTNQAGPNGGIKMTVTDVNTDTVLYTGSMGNHTENYSTYTIEDVGTISLNAGVTVLKLTFSGARYFADFRLTPYVENKIIADIDTEIAQGTGTETVTVPIKFEGNLTLGAIQVNVAYDEGVEYVSSAAGSCYEGGTSSISKAGENPVKVSWLDMDAVGVQFTTGTYATLTFNVPKSVAKDYNFTVSVIKCEQLTGEEEFTEIGSTIKTVNGKVSVISTDPIITLTDADGETVNSVVEGTMNVSVDLNGNDYDFVMFAIYTNDGEYAVLEYCGEAAVSGETATGSIENITFETGKTYYAKVFVWDEATCYGFSQTFSN